MASQGFPIESQSTWQPKTDASTNGPTTGSTNGPTNGSATATNYKDSIVNNAAAATNSIKNAQITQDLANGPMANSVKNHANATSNEFSSLAGTRAPPNYTAANDTPLTHYHSFFYSLLSWENPRATGITFAASILFIFACRYLPVIRWLLKISWMTLGVVTLAEVASKTVMGSSVTSSIRPRRYYKIPKESLEATLDDAEHFVNFFVIEVQRIIFAENIPATAAAFTAAFLSYYLVKLLPMWGMALLSTCVIYLLPLIYIQNKEVIDGHLERAGNVVSQQAAQARDLASHHAGKSYETVKGYTGEYANKAGDFVGTARQKIPMPASAQSSRQTGLDQTTGANQSSGLDQSSGLNQPSGFNQSSGVGENDFPKAPNSELPNETVGPATAYKPEPAY